MAYQKLNFRPRLEIPPSLTLFKGAVTNKILLICYLALFWFVVGNYESYRESTYLVALAAVVLLVTGLVFWLISIRLTQRDR